jgi:SAM-dependent methyltransferase
MGARVAPEFVAQEAKIVLASKRVCPVCGHSEHAPWLSKGALALVHCQQCGMIYALEASVDLSSGDYYNRAATDYYLSTPKLQSDYSTVRFERELRVFRRHCKTGSVLDVGCSTGGFLYNLLRGYPGQYRVLGTDVSGLALDYAKARGIPVNHGNFLENDFGQERFEAVTFWAVLEHLAEPAKFIEQAWRVLQPGGRLFVLVPNIDSLASRFLRERYRYIYPQHLNYFSKATLTRLVEPRFQIVEFRSTHFNPMVLWQDWRKGDREVTNQQRGALLEATTGWKQNPALKPAQLLYTLTERLLGKLTLADNLVMVLKPVR